ncbi:MAG TPA: ATP-binding protein [Caulobacterales bacterium]|nr:ATP-binding protein [Caulobacterales bacterium]
MRGSHQSGSCNRLEIRCFPLWKNATRACRCGGGPGAPCRRGPRCAIDYQARLSGPLLDRIDIQLDVPPVTAADLALPAPSEGSAEAANRVLRARGAQAARGSALNATVDLETLDRIAAPDAGGQALLSKAAETLALSARAYHRTLRVARTIADLDGGDGVKRIHIAEALSLKRRWASAEPGGFAHAS